METILITGGAGFVGSNLGILLKQDFDNLNVIALDNLKRRGSELSLSRLRDYGIHFLHGDVRIREDLLAVGQFDTIIDCSAEPSVLAGQEGSCDYVIQTNFGGTINCLEVARRYSSRMIFLSTSRVYPTHAINALKYSEEATRFELLPSQNLPGVSEKGISEEFPLDGARTLYGSSKLASELFIQEYVEAYELDAAINRCGIITGPWQMGKVDQGVVVHWVAKHIYEKELAYIGYGGNGKQVRDILHIRDLYDLIRIQLSNISKFRGDVYNVGGGRKVSVSLQELTNHCREVTSKSVSIRAEPKTRTGDIKCFLSDCSKVEAHTGWKPRIHVANIIEDIANWIYENKDLLKPILSPI